MKIAQFIVTRCYLVVVATPDLNSAYRIFSVLNTRGLDLSATDILKAEIIGGLSERLRETYTKKWEDAEEDLGRESFGELFSHIRMVYRKAKPQGTLLAEFRDHVMKEVPSVRFIDEILLPMAEVYEELTDEVYSSTERAEQVNEFLKWLNRLEFNDWMPPAMAFAVRCRNRPELMAIFFRDLERLAYWMLVCRIGVNDRIERFLRLTKAIESNEDLFASVSSLQISPQEQYSLFAVLSGPIYDTLSARARSSVLLRLDSLVAGGGATYHYETITVEHVLPQSPPPDSEWLTWFPNPENRALNVHILGNLVLLTRKKNSAASNYEFARKKEAYFTRGGVSPFALTTQVVRHQVWTPIIVEARQNELLSILEQHWRLQDRVRPSNVLRSILERHLRLQNCEDPAIEREAGAAYEGDGTWRDDVREGLQRLGGQGTLEQIYREVETIRHGASRSLPRSLEAVIRRTLEENSSDSQSYKDGQDMFCMPEGRGAGIWALRDKKSG